MNKTKILKNPLKALVQKFFGAKVISVLTSMEVLVTAMNVPVLVVAPNTIMIEGKKIYKISNAEDLYWFADQVNQGNKNLNVILTANIVVNSKEVISNIGDRGEDNNPGGNKARAWEPICFVNRLSDGGYNLGYKGTFDEQGYKISGLYFTDENKSCVGLFSFVGKGGVVKNLAVKNSYFKGASYVGGVVGWNEGEVRICKNDSKINGGHCVGGIAGLGYIESCDNSGTVIGYNRGRGIKENEDGGEVGGVIGHSGVFDLKVKNCTSALGCARQDIGSNDSCEIL